MGTRAHWKRGCKSTHWWSRCREIDSPRPDVRWCCASTRAECGRPHLHTSDTSCGSPLPCCPCPCNWDWGNSIQSLYRGVTQQLRRPDAPLFARCIILSWLLASESGHDHDTFDWCGSDRGRFGEAFQARPEKAFDVIICAADAVRIERGWLVVWSCWSCPVCVHRFRFALRLSSSSFIVWPDLVWSGSHPN